LGSAQLALYDSGQATSTNAQQLLEESRQSFSASIALEGMPTTGSEPRPELAGFTIVTYGSCCM